MKRFLYLIIGIFFIAGCAQQEPKQAGQSGGESVSAVASASIKPKVSQRIKARQYIKKGKEQLVQGNVALAIKNFDDAIRQNPADPTPYMVLGQTYLRLGDSARAIDIFSALLIVDPENGQAYYFLAIAQGLAGERELAKVNAQKSIEIFQSNQDEESFVRSLALLHGLVTADAPAKKE